MKIGIIGAGAIGKTYGTLWQQAGHQVMLSSRNPENIQLDNKYISIGTPEQAAAFGEVILLAVNYTTLDTAIDSIQSQLANKLVIDATNPLVHINGNIERVIDEDDIAGLLIAQRLPQARIAKALTTLWTGYVEQYSDIHQPSIAMPLAADNEHDRNTVAKLISDAGLVPVVLGNLKQSRPLDPPSPIWNVVLTEAELVERTRQFRAELAA